MNLLDKNKLFYKKLIKLYLIITLICLISFFSLAIGMRSALRQDGLFYLVKNIKTAVLSPLVTDEPTNQNYFAQLISYPSKKKIPPPVITDKTMVAFVFCKINYANHEGERYKAINQNVVNYFDGNYYIASDPLLGATGFGGSMWTITANKLIESQFADKVVILAAGVGGSALKHWKTGGALNSMLQSRFKDAKDHNIEVTHFLWHQGESDFGISEVEYTDGLTDVINLTQKYFPKSKFFVSQASRCYEVLPYAPILKAQRDITHLKNVYAGPNTDLIEDRFDGCHLSGKGVEKASEQWIELIKNPRKSLS
jgi:hypothetical protein